MIEEQRWPIERDCCQIEGEFREAKDQAKWPCLVVDLSDRGAGLEVPEDASLPPRFYLSLPLLEEMADERLVELKWRNGRAAGVMFV